MKIIIDHLLYGYLLQKNSSVLNTGAPKQFDLDSVRIATIW